MLDIELLFVYSGITILCLHPLQNVKIISDWEYQEETVLAWFLGTFTLNKDKAFMKWGAAAAAAKSLQSYPTLCDPIDGSPQGSPVPGILQAWTLEWAAISFSNAWKWKVKVKSLSRVRLLTTPWTTAYQAPPSMGFSRQEYWSGVPLPSPRYNIDGSYKWVHTPRCLGNQGEHRWFPLPSHVNGSIYSY